MARETDHRQSVGKLLRCRFPQALKRTRLAHGMKQRIVAERMGIPVRTLMSWEAGERLPTIGSVVLLNTIFGHDPLERGDLLIAYATDDLERLSEKVSTLLVDETLQTLSTPIQKIETILTQPSWELQAPSQKGTDEETLQQLLSLLKKLLEQPAMIPVVRDFLREMSDFS